MSQQLNKRWHRLCSDIANEARARGAKEPFLFACESGIVVLDGPPFGENEDSRQDSILFILPWPPQAIIACDAGGW